MIESTKNNDLIEYILALLNIPENSQAHAGCPTPHSNSIQAAHMLVQFMDEMPGGFLIYRAHGSGEILYVNKALMRILGCSTSKEFKELTKNSFRGMVHPDDLDEIEQSIQKQVAASQYDLDYVEYRVIRKDGAVRWVEDYGHFVGNSASGGIFYVFISDATQKIERHRAFLEEQRQKEQELIDLINLYSKERNLIHQEHLRRLEVIEGLSINYDSILYADLNADSILPYRLSDRTMRQFGQLSQTRSYHWFHTDYTEMWVHPEDRERVLNATSPDYIRDMLARNKTYYINYRTLYFTEIQYLQLRIVNVGGNSPASQIVMGYRRVDDEVQREIEQKQILKEALDNATLAITAKNTFLSNMSHDMRTPLNAIFGFTQLAKNCITDSEMLSYYLDRINASGKQLLDLIGKVLEITWSETECSQLDESACSLLEIMQGVVNSLHSQAEEKHIAVSLDFSALTHYNVYSNGSKLGQLLTCLVNNAVKYTPAGGRVTVSAIEMENLPNDYAIYQFIVEDNGIGISQDFINRIYEPFEREQNTTLSGVFGTGLGLTIAKNIVERMGGKIDINSKVGAGSKFIVTLRMRILQEEHMPLASIEETISRLTDQKILLVEDNEINLEIETELLKGLGFDIDTAMDGSIALEMMQKAKPGDYAFILMDIQMPIMNGHQATRAIRKLENEELAHIPIIALSADAFESDKRKSIESGMDAHLPKPIDIPALLETIAKTIQTHEILYGSIPRK